MNPSFFERRVPSLSRASPAFSLPNSRKKSRKHPLKMNQKPLFETPDLEPELVKKTIETLQAKQKLGLLTEEHAAYCQLAIELARSVAAGASKGKTSVAQSAQQLLNVLEALPTAPAENATDVLAEQMRAEV